MQMTCSVICSRTADRLAPVRRFLNLYHSSRENCTRFIYGGVCTAGFVAATCESGSRR